jgi:hypothetical protein
VALTLPLIALLAIAPLAIAQVTDPSPRQLLDLTRPLTTGEIAIVLRAAQEAMDGKTFRLSFENSDSAIRVLVGPGGRPRLAQMNSGMIHGIVAGIAPGAKTPPPSMTWREDITTILDYTGLPARGCDGSAEAGEMVIEYTRRGTAEWRVTARRQTSRDAGASHAFAMLRGAEPAVSGERRQIGTGWARAIVAPWTAPGDQRARVVEPTPLIGDPTPNAAGEPFPNDATQSLWIDTRTLLPLRWEVTKPDPSRVIMAGLFIYESFDLRPPAGIEAPGCVR